MEQRHPHYCDRFRDRIEELFEKDKIYLDPNLNMVDLAEMLRTNRTYLSQYFNREKNCSFYDYVNGLRIRNALRLLDTTEDKIEFIALNSGFSSITTFRRIFVKIVGIRASEYRKKKMQGKNI